MRKEDEYDLIAQTIYEAYAENCDISDIEISNIIRNAKQNEAICLGKIAGKYDFLLSLIRAKAKEQSGNAAHFANHLLTELKNRFGVE